MWGYRALLALLVCSVPGISSADSAQPAHKSARSTNPTSIESKSNRNLSLGDALVDPKSISITVEELLANADRFLNEMSKAGDFPPHEITTTEDEVRLCFPEPNGDRYCYIYNLRTGKMTIEIKYAGSPISIGATIVCSNGVCRITGPFGIEIISCTSIPLGPYKIQYQCTYDGQEKIVTVKLTCDQICIENEGVTTCTTLPADIIDLMRRGIFPFLPTYPTVVPSTPEGPDTPPAEYDPDTDVCGNWPRMN